MNDTLIDQMEEVQERHFWFRARTEILLGLLASRLKPGDRVLDAGCGTGQLLAALPDHIRPAGLDTSPRALEHAARRLANRPADLRPGHLPEAFPFPPGSLDWVLLTDVLEHIEDDRASLRTLHTALAPGGGLLLTVPAFRFLWSRHDEEHGHFRRYTAPELRARLEEAGFVIERLSYYNFLLFPLVLAVRLVKKLTGDHGNDMALPSPPVNQLLYTLFRGERHWLVRHDFPWGVSLIAIARKP
jgi:SAM-dependent methyltransferase